MTEESNKDTIEVFIDHELKEVFDATFALHGKTYSEVLEDQIRSLLQNIGPDGSE